MHQLPFLRNGTPAASCGYFNLAGMMILLKQNQIMFFKKKLPFSLKLKIRLFPIACSVPQTPLHHLSLTLYPAASPAHSVVCPLLLGTAWFRVFVLCSFLYFLGLPNTTFAVSPVLNTYLKSWLPHLPPMVLPSTLHFSTIISHIINFINWVYYNPPPAE